ncbi:MAG: anaerobic ribonucleoside-triphosphate reductase, partial [Anaerolineales bacterium]
ENIEATRKLIQKVAQKFHLPYFTLSPTFSVCSEHGYLSGEQYQCPYCSNKTEVYSRIVGYYRPVDNWNKGKKEELFSHYLLLPLYTWGIADWDFELIKPFVEEHHPTIGFSITEASKASRVTIAGNENSFSEDVVELLRDAGCAVQRLRDDGILVAS